MRSSVETVGCVERAHCIARDRSTGAQLIDVGAGYLRRGLRPAQASDRSALSTMGGTLSKHAAGENAVSGASREVGFGRRKRLSVLPTSHRRPVAGQLQACSIITCSFPRPWQALIMACNRPLKQRLNEKPKPKRSGREGKRAHACSLGRLTLGVPAAPPTPPFPPHPTPHPSCNLYCTPAPGTSSCRSRAASRCSWCSCRFKAPMG